MNSLLSKVIRVDENFGTQIRHGTRDFNYFHGAREDYISNFLDMVYGRGTLLNLSTSLGQVD